MSIIIEGIDLPSKDESPLVITVWADGIVCSVDSNGGIEETTSAIQIPSPHGRIGDLDELQGKAFEKRFAYQITEKELYVVNRLIEDNAPTILEAEE